MSVLNRSVFFENIVINHTMVNNEKFQYEVKLCKCLRCGAIIDKEYKKEHKQMHQTIDKIVDTLRI